MARPDTSRAFLKFILKSQYCIGPTKGENMGFKDRRFLDGSETNYTR